MTEIRYALLDPTGNQTVLVESEIPTEIQPLAAKRIMELEPEAEQVGFLSACTDGTAMRMAGGEFCGNAAMSAAALYAIDHGIDKCIVNVFFSGQKEPVSVGVERLPDGSVRGAVTMPVPVSVADEVFPDGKIRPVVRFEGIAHVILTAPLEREEAERLAPVWCRYLGSDSLGIMTLDREAGTLLPLVYVPAADTLFWENSCASGTTAVGAYIAAGKGTVSLSLKQPGGTLHVEKTDGGRLVLSGTVRLRYRRTVKINIW